jgi:hypothetical protein
MVKLKDRYPDRVHLIVGNRDCNKLRLGVCFLTHHSIRAFLVFFLRQSTSSFPLAHTDNLPGSMRRLS